MKTERQPCQVADPSIRLECKQTESGGKRCEVKGPHGITDHWISEHTIMHALAGNGYACSAIETRSDKEVNSDKAAQKSGAVDEG